MSISGTVKSGGGTRFIPAYVIEQVKPLPPKDKTALIDIGILPIILKVPVSLMMDLA
ncbi:MAG: hypothetical protein RMK19_08835 [Bacteroidia bacterium]|nr:hypothetical protein [Bacteroidia bacterium]MDW8016097.1 hypothetical protein [Bacteroidia bacterium]